MNALAWSQEYVSKPWYFVISGLDL